MTYIAASRDALAGRDLIVAERRRQIEAEGWTAEHDAEEGKPRLLRAAEAYEWENASRWPWDAEWWKPRDALSNLVRAGALYQAAADLGGYTVAADAGVARCAAKIDALLAAAMRTLITSGAVVAADSLDDDEAAEAAFWREQEAGNTMRDRGGYFHAGFIAGFFRALAAALTERK